MGPLTCRNTVGLTGSAGVVGSFLAVGFGSRAEAERLSGVVRRMHDRVTGPGYASTARDREAGYRDALAEAGVPVDETLLAGDSFLRVPDDLSLVGYNDIPVVSRLPVPLTTVRVPFPQIAANALELLRDAGNDTPPRTLVAAPTLIPRKSIVACAR